jgi:hypothetical protein
MLDLHPTPTPPQPAGNMHQAANVAPNDGIRAGRLDMVQFALQNGSGNVTHLDSEKTAKAAASFTLRQLFEFNSCDVTEQLVGLFSETQTPQPVTGSVIGQTAGGTGLKVGDAQNIHQKLTEFVGALGDPLGFGGIEGIADQDFGVVMNDHLGA